MGANPEIQCVGSCMEGKKCEITRFVEGNIVKFANYLKKYYKILIKGNWTYQLKIVFLSRTQQCPFSLQTVQRIGGEGEMAERNFILATIYSSSSCLPDGCSWKLQLSGTESPSIASNPIRAKILSSTGVISFRSAVAPPVLVTSFLLWIYFPFVSLFLSVQH